MFRANLLITLALSLNVSATPSQRAGLQPQPTFAGVQLASDLRGSPGVAKADQDPQVLYQQRFAEGYLEGAMSATEGSLWCRPKAIKPGELAELVATALERTVASRKRSAAQDVVQILQSKFPCPRRMP